MRKLRPFRSPDGTMWGVEVQVPGASNAMIVFHHPGSRTARLDRYAWYLWHGPESRNVTARIPTEKIMDSLSDADVGRLYRRSLPIAATGSPLPMPGVGGPAGVESAGAGRTAEALQDPLPR